MFVAGAVTVVRSNVATTLHKRLAIAKLLFAQLLENLHFGATRWLLQSHGAALGNELVAARAVAGVTGARSRRGTFLLFQRDHVELGIFLVFVECGPQVQIILLLFAHACCVLPALHVRRSPALARRDLRRTFLRGVVRVNDTL